MFQALRVVICMKKILQCFLLTLFVLALATRTYAAWRRGFDDPVHRPQTIIRGQSLAPHQYRILYPLMWSGLSLFMDETLADKVLLFGTIVACYGVLLGIYRALMRNLILACLGALAFLGTCMHPYQFQFRDTFLEVMLVTGAFYLQSQADRRPAYWNGLALLSVAGTLNRETWVFVLSGCFWAQANRLWRELVDPLPNRPVLGGMLKMAAATGAVVLASRLIWGVVPLYCDLWTWRENLPHILFWTYPAITIGHGIWGVGAGIFLIYLLSLLQGNRHQIRFIAGYLLPLLVVSFLLVARWIESRTFFPAFAVVIASLGMHLRQILSADPAGSPGD